MFVLIFLEPYVPSSSPYHVSSPLPIGLVDRANYKDDVISSHIPFLLTLISGSL